ncbi:hypothetical protein FVEN_g6758 [Fusarium venenatum]|uniref:Uncharacterized protein n=1 Tax=Fusarium venenatum TaxID=56646 RepID=A0A2L2T1Y6_9HYPO|nr:uncharacterized protein FVRRES_00140 [Fusarium venenatum]KAG8355363.1 hypothetical protein FVEN_g6758 [Fusarium venenatum]CEI63628.1 unnamed protein product [Fusarium venenatum]
MAFNPDFIHCTICGLVLKGEVVAFSGPHWPELCDAPPSLKVADEQVTRYDAFANSHRGNLTFPPDRQEIHPQWDYDVNEDSEDPSEWVGKMYVGIHKSCEQLLQRVISASPNAKVRSIGEFWLTLERRCARSKMEDSGDIGMHFTPFIPNPQPGKPFSCGLERYYVPSPTLYLFGNEWNGWWNEDPIAIPNLTTALIENLEHAPEPSSQLPEDLGQLTNHVEALPQKVKAHIYSLFQYGQSSLECTYLIPQSVWKQFFFQIPFLWDLDAQAVYHKTGKETAEIEKWNWEKISRQVMSPAQISTHEAQEDNNLVWSYEKVGLRVPGGFTNRRRIWQILEEMYPNDVQH